MILSFFALFFAFFKIGITGFGGGYAMLSVIFNEAKAFGITSAQFADLNALDMVVPGPIAINAATYVGFLYRGLAGAAVATAGVMLPSLILVPIVMIFINRYRENQFMNGFLFGIKPAAVGLIAAAALTIASDVLVNEGASILDIFATPLGIFSPVLVVLFLGTAVFNIKWKVNPILLTVLAGIAGALFLR